MLLFVSKHLSLIPFLTTATGLTEECLQCCQEAKSSSKKVRPLKIDKPDPLITSHKVFEGVEVRPSTVSRNATSSDYSRLNALTALGTINAQRLFTSSLCCISGSHTARTPLRPALFSTPRRSWCTIQDGLAPTLSFEVLSTTEPPITPPWSSR